MDSNRHDISFGKHYPAKHRILSFRGIYYVSIPNDNHKPMKKKKVKKNMIALDECRNMNDYDFESLYDSRKKAIKLLEKLKSKNHG